MSKTFTKVKSDAFENFQLNAGLVLNTFNPTSPKAPADSEIICATTGGIEISVVPTYMDFGDDVDGCPKNTKELKHIESYECKMSFTAVDVTEETIKLALGAATVASNKITPNSEVASTDFADIWWVGDRADGKAVAICIKNALSTGGLVLSTESDGKGNIAVELTGHVSLDAQDTVPAEFYIATISA